MPAPTLSSSSPANGATNVAKNVTLTATFSTALLATSVDARTVFLRYGPTKEVVPSTISLSTSGTVITVVPNFLLIPNSAYQLVLVGHDVSTTTRILSSDSTPLATTGKISFQTGDSLSQDSSTGVKTTTDALLEGEAVLPDDIGFRTTAVPLRLIRTSPKQHAFGIATDTTRLRLEFTAPIDISTVTGNISVVTEAFYGEEDLRAARADIDGEGLKYYFAYETGNYTGNPYTLDPDLFQDPSFTYSVTGNFLDINITPYVGSVLPNNICFNVEIGRDIATTSGVELDDDLVYFVCVKPYPEWNSVTTVRHEIGAFSSNETPDDFVGLRIWRSTIDMWSQLWTDISLTVPSQYHKLYTRLRAALDVWDDLMVAKYLNSGVVKELGDLRIQYNTGSGGAKSRKVRELEERLEKLYRNIWGFYTQRPRIGVKSEWDHYEPSRDFFRDRLWRMELTQNRGEAGLAGRIAANTAYTRGQELFSRGFFGAVWYER
jgi:hypothetical protein